MGVAVAYQLLLERPAEADISHSILPTPDEYTAFVKSHPYRVWFVIETDAVVGTIYLTRQNEIGIAILNGQQRKGYAEEAVKRIIEAWPPLPGKVAVRNSGYVAHVASANMPSLALFSKIGAKVVSVTYRFGD